MKDVTNTRSKKGDIFPQTDPKGMKIQIKYEYLLSMLIPI